MRSPWGQRRTFDSPGGSVVSGAVSSGLRFMRRRQERETEISGTQKEEEKAACLDLHRRWIGNYTFIPQRADEDVRIFCQ